MVTRTERTSSRAWWPMMIVVALGAFALRLQPVLAGGGLFGRGNYDDGVYYAAAAGFVHGLLPYRDYLLLHPPGIVLALAPFAALARWVGEPEAFATARVAFMVVGAGNTLLVGVALRRLGLAASVIGGGFYAVFFPAVYVEHTTVLEPLATTCLLGAVALLEAGPPKPARPVWPVGLAGVLLGVSASLKIWGVVPAVAVIGWVLLTRGWRRGLVVSGGVAAGATAVCLPFFAAAPVQMWRLVVLAQLGRPRSSHGWLDRVATMAGLTAFGRNSAWWWPALAVVLALGCCVIACWSAVGRLAVLLLAATVTLLLATPSWFLHYGALSAGPLALVVGAAAGSVAGRVRRPATAAISALLVAATLVGLARATLDRPFGQRFPASGLAAAVLPARGCVTADDPISLIELDVLSRNLARGCPLVADLGGYNYALQVGATRFRSRAADPRWQVVALDYLRGGDVAVLGVRFHHGFGYTAATAKELRSWPRLGGVGHDLVRRPSGQLAAR